MGKLKITLLFTIVFVLVSFPEFIFSLLMELLFLLAELIHVFFEIVEVTLDMLVEHLFHTDLHQTQVIVFYILMLMVGYALLLLWRALPRYYQYCTEKLSTLKARYRLEVVDYFQCLSFFDKAQFALLAIVVGVGLFFLLF